MELISSSIVFQLEKINENPFFKFFLYDKKIIDKSWKISKIEPKMPLLSFLTFDNGYSIKFVESRIIFEVIYPSPGDLQTMDNLDEISVNFAKSSEFLNYKAIGINYKIFIYDNLSSLGFSFGDNFKLNGLNLKIDADNYNMNNQIEQKKIKDKDVIVIDSNFHHDLVLDKNLIDQTNFIIKNRYDYLKQTIKVVDELRFQNSQQRSN
jgi:hypothetical protein